MVVERVAPLRLFTPRETEVANLVGRGLSYPTVAATLLISERTVAQYAHRIAQALPGDLPAQTKIRMWYRGATAALLASHKTVELNST